jgi:hypothetical protein
MAHWKNRLLARGKSLERLGQCFNVRYKHLRDSWTGRAHSMAVNLNLMNGATPAFELDAPDIGRGSIQVYLEVSWKDGVQSKASRRL